MRIARQSLESIAWASSFMLCSGRVLNDKPHLKGKVSGPTLKGRLDIPEVHYRSTENFRFLNAASKSYQVTSLPDVPFDVGEMYAGLIPIDSNDTSRALYFVYQPTIGTPVNEVTIWLNGGPGCSSLEGFFQENGRFLWQKGLTSPQINPYSWVNLTNMLWVEQPVGTGFSIGNITATSEEEIAQDFVKFFKNFEQVFGIKDFKIYVTGESYAGRYVPYISAAMIEKHDRTHFDLAGALAYDPCIGADDYTQEEAVVVPFVLENNAMLSLNDSFLAQLAALDQSCGYAEYRSKFFKFPPPGIQPDGFFDYVAESACDVFNMANAAVSQVNPCFNIYHISETCPLAPDVLGLNVNTPGFPVYFDRADVKAAMHAPDIEWSECSNVSVFIGPSGLDDNFQNDTSLDPIQHVLPKVIEHTNRVLVSNGNLDMIIITNGTLLAIQNMTWHGKLGFQQQPSTPIVITEPDLQYGQTGSQGTMGIQHFERGLMWAESYQAGHMQPEYQPRTSYRHIQWVLGRIDAL